jgi:hypothetical protein
MANAVLLSLLVALSIVSVPVLMHRILLLVKWQMPSFRRWAAQTAVIVFGLELVLSALYGVAFAAFAGSVLLAGVATYFGYWTWRSLQLQASCKGLLLPDKSAASLVKIEHELERRRKRGERSDASYQGYARLALFLAATLDSAGFTPLAIRAVEEIEPSRLPPSMRAMRAQGLAAYLIRSGDRDAARRQLAAIPRPVADPIYEDALLALDTLLMVLEGNAKEAETRARPALERVKVSTVVAAWQAVLAHALVAQGARDEAVTILEEMKKSHGDAAIARVVRQNGPASPLAESMQADTGTPYR